MEDAHIAQLEADQSTKTSLFAVFDGHGGRAVSQYCAAHLAEELMKTEAYRKGDLAGAITYAYYRLDELLDSEDGKAELRRLVAEAKPKQAGALFTDVESKLAGPAHAHEERVERTRTRSSQGSEDATALLAGSIAEASSTGATAPPSNSSGDTGGASASSPGSGGGGSAAPGRQTQVNTREAEAEKAMKRVGSSKEFMESHLARASVLTPLEQASASQQQQVHHSPAVVHGSSGSSDPPGTAAQTALETVESGVVLGGGGAALPNGSASEEEDEEEHHAAGMGATAVSVLVRGPKIVVANTGDSRAVLSKRGQARALTQDHKPILFEEAKRIIKAGGFVRDNRINGALNVSRTLGDLDFKRNTELPHTEQMVVATPDIEYFTLEEGDEFLILACDGIWDVLTNQEAVDFVRKRLKAGDGLKSICEQMCDACLATDLKGMCRGADNMSVIVVLFKKHAKLGGFWSSLLKACGVRSKPAYNMGSAEEHRR